MGKRWVPLEANPEVLTNYAKQLGLDTSKMTFCDVYSLDDVSGTCKLKFEQLVSNMALILHTTFT